MTAGGPLEQQIPANAALVTVDATGAKQALRFRYNPSTVRRTIEPFAVGGSQGMRSQAMRFAGAAAETFSIECQFSAVDAMDAGLPAATMGVAPQLAALALLAYPSTASVAAAQQLLDTGAVEIVPQVANLLLFVWGGGRVVPVRLVSVEIVEQLFDTGLWPIQATATVSMRALTYSDVAPDNPAYQQFLVYQQSLESLASMAVDSGGPSS